MPTLCVEGLAKLTGGAGDGNAFSIITCNYYTMWVVCVVVKFNGKITCSMAPRFTNEMDCGWWIHPPLHLFVDKSAHVETVVMRIIY